MITLTCDKCDSPFSVADGKPGQKVACPACGDINLVPAMGVAVSVAAGGGVAGGKGPTVTGATAAGRAEAAGLPPAAGPETTVITTRGAMFRSAPFSFAALALLALAGLFGATGLIFSGLLPFGLAALGIGLVGLGALVVWKVRNLGERLEITNKRVIFTRGLLSKTSLEMVYRTIQDIEIQQTFAKRILNVGTITIANASSDDDVVVIHDVPKPYRIREIIDAYRPM